ncbi:DUF1642 domain-containing protein [Paucilactobacillus kaifaensis]|uniref:DUF1642 domain-containing protein n=1 Tax=Paucilactobacillus kaifaensis TaxID=2559921 RepID=UPI0010F563B4|nr:DUF1642 domain-containing protein [Paucilactobacillus kaifaensis]
MKYKSGDEILIKARINAVDDGSIHIYSDVLDGHWVDENAIGSLVVVDPTEKVKVPKWFDEWYHENDGNDKNDVECIRILSVSDKLYWLNGNEINQSLENKDRTKFIQAIIDGYEVEQEKRYVLPMEGTELTDGSMKSKPRIAYLVPDEINPRWNTKALFQATAEKNPTFQVAQSQLDNAPDWVKAIKPVEVEPDENN